MTAVQPPRWVGPHPPARSAWARGEELASSLLAAAKACYDRARDAEQDLYDRLGLVRITELTDRLWAEYAGISIVALRKYRNAEVQPDVATVTRLLGIVGWGLTAVAPPAASAAAAAPMMVDGPDFVRPDLVTVFRLADELAKGLRPPVARLAEFSCLADSVGVRPGWVGALLLGKAISADPGLVVSTAARGRWAKAAGVGRSTLEGYLGCGAGIGPGLIGKNIPLDRLQSLLGVAGLSVGVIRGSPC